MFTLWRHRLKARSDTANLLRQKGEITDPAERDRLQQRLGHPTVTRPNGALLWVHGGQDASTAAIALLVARLREDRDALHVLITSENGGTISAIPGTIAQELPADTDDAAARFLDHWAPQACLWVGANWAPVLLAETANRAIPALCADIQLNAANTRLWQGPLARGPLAAFEKLITESDDDGRRLIAAGARAERVETCGWLEASNGALPCIESDWSDLSEAFGARPIWLAAGIPEGEFAAVSQAHRWASRLAHRLLLILTPLDPADGPAWRDRLEAEGWQTALRSCDEEPAESTQIYLADTEGEMGLWYRLAPVTFLGQTLEGPGPGRSPMEPAALGSVLVHGPNTEAHGAAYQRLRQGRAHCAVTSGDTLGRMIERLQSPDKAAEFANAAWEVMTSGAEATDRTLELLNDMLNRSDP